MSNLKVDHWLNPDGTENYKCRAWVNFNGTGTVAIRGSGNVSSITDNGTGDYTVNFTNALPDANYATIISMGTENFVPSLNRTNAGSNALFTQTTTAVKMLYMSPAAASATDATIVTVVVVG